MNIAPIKCIQSQMGDWTYYLATLPFSEAASKLKFAYEVNKKTDLDHLIQRELTKRSEDIVNYLTTQPQRLFGALICASFGKPIKFRPTGGNFGDLVLDGQDIYVLDGQHRLAAIKEAVKKNPEKFRNDHVSVLLVFHDITDAGYKRARRLFTTVNRYAKQTSKATNRVMDEDDGVSFLLLRFIREFAIFANHIKFSRLNKKKQIVLAQSESMSKADARYLMSVSSLYEVIFNLLPSRYEPIFQKRQVLPATEILDDAYGEVEWQFNELFKVVACWNDLQKGTISDLSGLRTPSGGHPLVRPVAIIPFARAFKDATEAGISSADIKAAVSKYSDLTNQPWLNLLWDPARNRMHGGQEVKRLTYRVWRALLGVSSKKELQQTKALWRSKTDSQGRNRLAKWP